MFRSLGGIDAVALTQRIEIVGPSRMTAPRQGQRIHHPVHGQRPEAQQRQLKI